MINIDLIIQSLPVLLSGLIVSLKIAASALAIGFCGGTLLALLQTSESPVFKNLVTMYVGLFRGTPMIVQIVFLYYVLSITGIALKPVTAAILAIGLNSMAYVSQIIKAGIQSINKGQLEAAKTLGIKRRDMIRYIILPQAIRAVLPALGNEAVTLVKDSSLASIIGVPELYKQGQTIISHTYDALSIYCAIALFYLVVTATLSFAISRLETYLNPHAHH